MDLPRQGACGVLRFFQRALQRRNSLLIAALGQEGTAQFKAYLT
jgi:hypothetical protein